MKHLPASFASSLGASLACGLLLGLSLSDAQAQKPAGQTAGKLPAARQKQSDPIDQHFHAAETFQVAGEFDKASAEYRQALIFGLDRMGNVRVLTGDTRKAEDLFARALQIDPTSIPARLDLSYIEFRSGKVDQAAEDINRVVSADPQNAKALTLRGKVRFAQGDFAGAADDLQAALRIDPDFDTAYTLALADLKQKKRPEAGAVFDELLAGSKSTPELYSLIGVAYRETGYYEDALRQFRKAEDLDPKHVHVHAGTGIALFEQGEAKYPEAQQEFEKEIAINPGDFEANYYLGVIALQQHRAANAEQFLKKAIASSPAHLDSWFYLGKAQFEQGRWNDATLSLVRSLGPPEDAARKEKIDEAKALIEQARSKGAPPPAPGPQQVAQSSAETGKTPATGLQQLALGFSNAYPAAPQTAEEKRYEATVAKILAEAYNNLGVIDAHNGNLARAAREFEQAERWNPELENVDRNWALAAFRSQQYADAIEPLGHQLAKKEDFTQREMLGLSYFMTDQYVEAARTFYPVLDFLPNDPAILYAAGVSLVRARHPAEAARIFDRLLKQNDKNPEIHVLLGQAYASQQDYNHAREELNRALALDSHAADAHYYLGMADFYEGKMEDSAREFQNELALNPKNDKAAYQLAYVRLQEHRNDEAVVLLNGVLEREPDNGDALYQRGKATLEKGDAVAALKDLERAAQLNPQGDYIYYQLSLAYRAAGRPQEAAAALKNFNEIKAKKTPVRKQ